MAVSGNKLNLKVLDYCLTVCKLESVKQIDPDKEFFFVGKTEDEISLVCQTKDVPAQTLAREDGWKAFCIVGVLDFSLIGILAKISNILADNGVSIFAVSTYNTDYILVKEDKLAQALEVLAEQGFSAE